MSQAFLVLQHDLLVLLELVPHFNLNASRLVQFSCLCVELYFQLLQFLLLGFKGLL